MNTIIQNQRSSMILIVDDEPANIQVIAKILETDYRIRFTTRGEKAVDLAISQHPDLILLDVVMSDMDGYSVCQALKANEATRDIPVIFVTAKGEEQYEFIGFEMGGVDYISKPVKPFLLKARIRTHIALKKQNDLLKSLVNLDGLTGIANRRRFDEYFTQEWRRALRMRNSHLSCVMLDVDFFKRFNDGYGHYAGDDCLRQVAQILKSSMGRSTDLAARYGGEEFVCILPETKARGAIHLAEQIQLNLAARAIPHDYSDIARQITVSIGVATIIPNAEQNPSVLLQAADAQLYQSKHNGRNRISNLDLTIQTNNCDHHHS